MTVQTRPLAEISQEALRVLFQTMGIVNTVRFITQFTTGYGNYTTEREGFFGDITLEEVITEIKRDRSQAGELAGAE